MSRKEKTIRDTKAQVLRQENWRAAPVKGVKNYANGAAQELCDASPASKKTEVSARGVHDNDRYITCQDGKKRRIEVESKTSGGRLDHIIEMCESQHPERCFVAYTLDVCNKNTGYSLRRLPTIIVPATVFMEAVYSLGAIKENRLHGVLRGYSLQPSLKRWAAWVEEYPIKYDPNEPLEWWMFEGL